MIEVAKATMLVTDGTNCANEMQFAFSESGAIAEIVHVTQIQSGERNLDDVQIVGLPGGFGYGDRIGSGYVQGVEIQTGRLGEQLQRHVERGRQVLGVCNGFQVLVRSGLLPWGVMLDGAPSGDVALAQNENNRFYNNNVDLIIEPNAKATGARGMQGETVEWPVAHGEGCFVVVKDELYQQFVVNGQIVLRYAEGQNFNGSYERIAGISNPDGTVIGMMPHPERPLDGPDRTPSGLFFFENMVYRANNS